VSPDRPGAGAFGRFHHLGIAVPVLDEVVERVRALLEGEVVEQGVDAPLAISWVWIASEGNPIIEFVAPTDDTGPIARYLAKHGPGMHHISFDVPSLDPSLSHARSCCLDVMGENPDHGGFAEFFVDPRLTGGALFHAFAPAAPAHGGA
jgi:hypothetical protein